MKKFLESLVIFAFVLGIIIVTTLFWVWVVSIGVGWFF